MTMNDTSLNRNLIIQRLTQKLCNEQCSLQLKTKNQIAALLANQELSLCGTSIEKFFSSAVQIDENSKAEYQKYIRDSLCEIKSELNGVLELCNEDFSWRNINDLIKENVALKQKIIDGVSFLELQINAYLTKLNDYLEAAKNYSEAILSNHDVQQYEFFKVWFGVKSTALLLKIKLMMAKLDEKTFTSNDIQRLSQISQFKKDEISNLYSRIAEVKLSLKAYAALSGSAFDDLIANYGKLTKDIEDKRWALREFSSSNDHSKNTSFDDVVAHSIP